MKIKNLIDKLKKSFKPVSTMLKVTLTALCAGVSYYLWKQLKTTRSKQHDQARQLVAERQNKLKETVIAEEQLHVHVREQVKQVEEEIKNSKKDEVITRFASTFKLEDFQ